MVALVMRSSDEASEETGIEIFCAIVVLTLVSCSNRMFVERKRWEKMV